MKMDICITDKGLEYADNLKDVIGFGIKEKELRKKDQSLLRILKNKEK